MRKHMNGITTNLGIEDSLSLFLSHYKYGTNYEDSTILRDPAYNIIAFFDRGTTNIDAVEAELPFRGDWIVANGKKRVIGKQLQYEPYDWEMAVNRNAVELNKLKQEGNEEKIKALYSVIRKGVDEYNKNYFRNLPFTDLMEEHYEDQSG